MSGGGTCGAAMRVALGAVAAAAVAVGAAGCGGGGGSSSPDTAAGPTSVVRCLNAHNLKAHLSPRRGQYNIAAVHEIRIPLGTPGQVGDGFVEYLNNPGFAQKVAHAAASHFHEVAAAAGTTEYEFPRGTSAADAKAITLCWKNAA